MQERGVSSSFLLGLVDPNCLEHDMDEEETSPEAGIAVTDMPELSADQEASVRQAGKLLTEAGEMAIEAHRLLTQAEMLRGEAYKLLDGLEDEPIIRKILDPKTVDFPDGIEGTKTTKQFKAEVLSLQSQQEPKGSGAETDATVVYDVKKAVKAAKRKRQGARKPARKLSTGSVVSTGKPILGYRVPDDFPGSWPLKYRPRFIGGGPNENRVYICQFPNCGAHVSKLDPCWSHLAHHMGQKAVCPFCNASYWNPCGMRAHMRTHLP
jgi:hypothetical protein